MSMRIFHEHVWGEYVAGHAILIVGWDDMGQSWICKNSWGPLWGEDGYFRIKWGSCEIGTYMPFIWDDVISSSELSIFPEKIEHG